MFICNEISKVVLIELSFIRLKAYDNQGEEKFTFQEREKK